MITRPTALALLLTTVLASSACRDETLEAIDRNGDHKVSEVEFVTGIQELAFDELDADDNQLIDEKEWLAKEDVRDPHARFDSLDNDSSGDLSLQEFSSSPRKKRTLRNLFKTFDKNEDGQITEEEHSR